MVAIYKSMKAFTNLNMFDICLMPFHYDLLIERDIVLKKCK